MSYYKAQMLATIYKFYSGVYRVEIVPESGYYYVLVYWKDGYVERVAV